MKLLVNLGNIFNFNYIFTCDDCSSITTKSSCTGSCQWTTGKEATYTASISCSINSESSGCEPVSGCSFTSAVKTDPTCTAKSVEDDNSEGCAAAGYTYDTSNTVCNVPSYAVSGEACTPSTGCEFTSSTGTTPASSAAITTCQLNSDKTACETSDGCKFTDATAGNCAEKSSNNENILKMSLLLHFYLHLPLYLYHFLHYFDFLLFFLF